MFKSRFWALSPLLLFVILYLVTSLVLNDFYKIPVIVAFLISSAFGLLIYPRHTLHSKIEEFTKGAGDSGIMLMILIFLLAGAFANLSKSIGAVDSAVNIALHLLPANLLIPGLFLTACFISLSLGTSVGTIVALAPIAAGLNESIPGTITYSLAAVVGGAMFGDNLSVISDTTIAATRTQGVEMAAKFKVNLMIALPAAILTFAIYAATISIPEPIESNHDYSFLKLIPYLFVFIFSISGMNVIRVLIIGIAITICIGYIDTNLTIWDMVNSVNTGLASMFELSILCLLIGGVVGLIRFFGGIDFILEKVSSRITGKRGAEFSIASLTALVNLALANNTITILIVGPLARTIAVKNGVDLRRSASILDTISCFIQGVIPYGAQILAALAFADKTVTPLGIMQYLYYPYLLGGATIVFILIGPYLKPRQIS